VAVGGNAVVVFVGSTGGRGVAVGAGGGIGVAVGGADGVGVGGGTIVVGETSGIDGYVAGRVIVGLWSTIAVGDSSGRSSVAKKMAARTVKVTTIRVPAPIAIR
jgi:hypothetical protein